MTLNPTSSLQLYTTCKLKCKQSSLFSEQTENGNDYKIQYLFTTHGGFPCEQRMERVEQENRKNVPCQRQNHIILFPRLIQVVRLARLLSEEIFLINQKIHYFRLTKIDKVPLIPGPLNSPAAVRHDAHIAKDIIRHKYLK